MLVMDKVHEIGGIPTEASAFDNDDNEGNNEEGDDANEPLRPEIAMKISADNPSSIIFKQLFELRMTQLKQGVDLSNLTRVQWGLAPLKFSHHIVIKESSIKEFPYMFEIIVCTACSPVQNSSSCPVFLGVYGDQESALLVSDVHEILNGMPTLCYLISSHLVLSYVDYMTDVVFLIFHFYPLHFIFLLPTDTMK